MAQIKTSEECNRGQKCSLCHTVKKLLLQLTNNLLIKTILERSNNKVQYGYIIVTLIS